MLVFLKKQFQNSKLLFKESVFPVLKKVFAPLFWLLKPLYNVFHTTALKLLVLFGFSRSFFSGSDYSLNQFHSHANRVLAYNLRVFILYRLLPILFLVSVLNFIRVNFWLTA